MTERWAAVPVTGFEDRYKVSNFGRVKRIKASLGTSVGYILKANINKQTRYPYYMLWNYPKYKSIAAHRLVALAFIPNPDNLPQINHIDYDRSNPRADNLEWCDASGNALHSFAHGRKSYERTGEHKVKVGEWTKKAWAAGKFANRPPHSEETKAKISATKKQQSLLKQQHQR